MNCSSCNQIISREIKVENYDRNTPFCMECGQVVKKMKLSFITPTPWIEKYGSQSDFILALAHLIPYKGKTSQETSGYDGAIRQTGLPILLDNGLFEKHIPEPTEDLIGKAVYIGAHTFFAPDFLFDGPRTQIELDHTIALNNYMKTGIKVGAVVQASNREDYLKQLLDFNANPDVDLIGLSILSIPESFGGSITGSRIELMKVMILFKESRPGFEWKQMHLLGIGDSYEDVIFASENCPWIVSNDSSCAFQSGYKGKKLTDKLEVPGGKVRDKAIFGLQHLTEEMEECIQYNIDIIKKVIQKDAN